VALADEVTKFKGIFSGNPTLLTAGQFYLSVRLIEALDVLLKAALDQLSAPTYTGTIKLQVDTLRRLFTTVRNHANDPLSNPLGSDTVPSINRILNSAGTVPATDPVSKLKKLVAGMPPGPGVAPDASWWGGGLTAPFVPVDPDFARAAKTTNWEYDKCFTSTNRLAQVVGKSRSQTGTKKAMSVSGFATSKKSSGSNTDAVSYNAAALKTHVATLKDQLDHGFVVVAGTASGGSLPANWETNPNHYILIFAYEGDTFAFWDSDSSVTTTALGKAFGKLYYANDRLGTAKDDSDLETSGSDHVAHVDPGDHRHRYQITTLQGFP
jgi:hypothetical protein